MLRVLAYFVLNLLRLLFFSVRVQGLVECLRTLSLTADGQHLCDKPEGLSFQSRDWTGIIATAAGVFAANKPGLLLSALHFFFFEASGLFSGVKGNSETLECVR